jgi:cellulose 1,4-beta-cellobiosidase
VTLTWTASSGASGYRVKRATASGGPYNVVATTSSTSYTDAVANGTTVFYVVSAVNTAGESANSAEAGATPPGPLPAAPSALSATSSKIKGGSVKLAWTQSTSPNLTQNAVYRRTSTGTYGAPLATFAPATTYTDARAPSGSYCYAVSALTCSGEGVRSVEACATVR